MIHWQSNQKACCKRSDKYQKSKTEESTNTQEVNIDQIHKSKS